MIPHIDSTICTVFSKCCYPVSVFAFIGHSQSQTANISTNNKKNSRNSTHHYYISQNIDWCHDYSFYKYLVYFDTYTIFFSFSLKTVRRFMSLLCSVLFEKPMLMQGTLFILTGNMEEMYLDNISLKKRWKLNEKFPSENKNVIKTPI